MKQLFTTKKNFIVRHTMTKSKPLCNINYRWLSTFLKRQFHSLQFLFLLSLIYCCYPFFKAPYNAAINEIVRPESISAKRVSLAQILAGSIWCCSLPKCHFCIAVLSHHTFEVLWNFKFSRLTFVFTYFCFSKRTKHDTFESNHYLPHTWYKLEGILRVFRLPNTSSFLLNPEAKTWNFPYCLAKQEDEETKSFQKKFKLWIPLFP